MCCCCQSVNYGDVGLARMIKEALEMEVKSWNEKQGEVRDQSQVALHSLPVGGDKQTSLNPNRTRKHQAPRHTPHLQIKKSPMRVTQTAWKTHRSLSCPRNSETSFTRTHCPTFWTFWRSRAAMQDPRSASRNCAAKCERRPIAH